MKDYKLCYIDDIDEWCRYKLYFTDNYEYQWGDDWDDRPANCNAEPPYEDDTHHIVSMYIEFNWMVSDIVFGGKNYSVEDMNKSGVPWLIFKDRDYVDYKLMGGDTLIDVLTKLETSGVTEYWLDKKITVMTHETAKEILSKED